MATARTHVLGLYRSILKGHQRILPSDLRQLGDKYVRDEFKRHKAAKPEFIASFMSEWQAYLQQLEQGAMGRELSQEELEALNDEQQVQLRNLRLETEKDWRDG